MLIRLKKKTRTQSQNTSLALMSVLCIFSLLFWFINTVIHPRRIPALHFISSPSICLAFLSHCHHLSRIPQVHLQFSFSFTVSSPTASLSPSGNFSTLFLCCVCPWGHGGILPSAISQYILAHAHTCMHVCTHTESMHAPLHSRQKHISPEAVYLSLKLSGGHKCTEVSPCPALVDENIRLSGIWHWQHLCLNC